MTELKAEISEPQDYTETAMAAVDSTIKPMHVIDGMTDADRQELAKQGVKFKTGVTAELDAVRVAGMDRPNERQAGRAVLDAMPRRAGDEAEGIDTHTGHLDTDRGTSDHQIEAHTDTTIDKSQATEKPSLEAVVTQDMVGETPEQKAEEAPAAELKSTIDNGHFY